MSVVVVQTICPSLPPPPTPPPFFVSMGGDHGHSKIALPDWRQWKIDGTPLELTHRRLKANNLKDPWLRSVFFLAELWTSAFICISWPSFLYTGMRRGGFRVNFPVLRQCRWYCLRDSSGALLLLLFALPWSTHSCNQRRVNINFCSCSLKPDWRVSTTDNTVCCFREY